MSSPRRRCTWSSIDRYIDGVGRASPLAQTLVIEQSPTSVRKCIGRSSLCMTWLDFKLGGRMLVKYPGLTIVGGLAMAFAIWVGIVIFQVVGLFTNPTLPLSQGARLVEIRVIDVAASDEEEKILHDFLQWQQS